MQTLQSVLAFPMFATVIWLTWVLGQQAGIDGAAALLVALLVLALAAWWWGQRPAKPAGARRCPAVAIASLTRRVRLPGRRRSGGPSHRTFALPQM